MALFIFQVIFNLLIPDHNAGVFDPPQDRNDGIVEYIVSFLVSGLHCWDSKHFIHIAHHGYIYENSLAFFPLFPILTWATANTILYPVQFCISYDLTLCCAALLLNLVLFVVSSVYLYKLSLIILQNERLAYKSVQLFCMNPASIFFTAYYSESCFALFTFAGLFYTELGHTLPAVFCFSLSGFTRSNGVINIGYLLYKNLYFIPQSFLDGVFKLNYFLYNILKKLTLSLFSIFFVLLPFGLYQAYAFIIYCIPNPIFSDASPRIIEYGNAQKYKLPNTGSAAWCSSKIPLSYSYIQSHYWNNGFLNYYELKQIPNFILATPIVIISFSVAYTYLKHIRNAFNLKIYLSGTGFTEDHGIIGKYMMRYKPLSRLYYKYKPILNPECFPHVIHICFMVSFGLMFMHVQVIICICNNSCFVT